MTAAELREIEPGTLIEGRYEIERLIDGKGMGVVFRAHDRQNGLPVAFKHFRRQPVRGDAGELFLREAQALVGLRHPGIATHLAWGLIEGQAFLVMEWLEGESLAERLRRQPLRVGESLALVRQVAGTLGELHRRGLAHRDLRPRKLLLRDGQLEGVTLLGCGFAFSHVSMRTMTTSGELAALLRYVAPELARGGTQPGPSADIFALGCILFECLLGAAPFADESAAVILARLLYEEVPHLDRLRPAVPEALAQLLEGMLDKHPGRRLPDGAALGEALARLVVTPEQAERVLQAPVSRLEKQEQRMVSLLLVAPPQDQAGEGRGRPASEDAAGRVASPMEVEGAPGSELAAWLAPHSASAERLADGSLIVTVAEEGQTAIDRAVQVARVARALRARLPRWPMVVATGRGRVTETRLAGEALGLAFAILTSRERRSAALDEAARVRGEPLGEGGGPPGAGEPIWLDVLTAGLLDTRFQVERLAGGPALGQERLAGDEQRPLLGQVTPFVGRDQELNLLLAVMAGALAEPEARAMLVTAPSGTGKSRLRQEFVRRLETREEGVEVLLGRGDPLRTDKPYGLLGAMLLDLCALGDVTGLRERQEGLARRVGRHLGVLGEAERRSVVEFLGALCGVPFPDEGNAPLRAARQDPRLMNDHLTDACLAFLRAECAAHPVLLVLEDLHWGDAATVRLVDAALRDLAERPLMVLALARPEVRERFPRLWAERSVHEMHLGGLNRRASERLAKAVLRERAQPELVERIAEQAGGNALFLEELIRAAAEAGEAPGPGRMAAPATVLAMLEARFVRFPDDVRRVLRAASIFGETFWRGGVSALLGAERESDQAAEQGLEVLMAAEVVVRQGQSRWAGEVQFAFRHALLRDVAYGLLTEEDRRLGHRLAGGYLERMGERDATVLAEHWRLGGEGERAAALFAEAAEQALASSDLAGALRCVEQGMACGASGEMLGTLQTLAAWAHFWASDFAQTVALGGSAMTLLPPGSSSWYRAMGLFMVMTSQSEELRQLVRSFIEAVPQPGAERAFVVPAVGANMQISLGGMRDLSRALVARLQEFGARLGEDDVHVQGMIHATLIWEPLLFEGDLWRFRGTCLGSVERLTRAGDRRFVATMRAHIGFAEALLGDAAAGLGELRTQLAELARLGEMFLRGCFLAEFAVALVASGVLGEARTVAEELLAGPMTGFWRALGQSSLAGALLGLGDVGAAEEVARQALGTMAPTPVGTPLAAAVLGRCLLVQGRAEEARAVAEEGLASLAALGGTSFMDVKLLLLAAEARQALGEAAAARQALAAAAARIERRAAGLPEPAWRERFERLPDHTRVRALLQR
ncbi:MAG TPA: AAA family ATPase [Polyangia bacterium]|nr:AAA family ATPase [Polyangia bacterium]